jgi:hypothetical protein
MAILRHSLSEVLLSLCLQTLSAHDKLRLREPLESEDLTPDSHVKFRSHWHLKVGAGIMMRFEMINNPAYVVLLYNVLNLFEQLPFDGLLYLAIHLYMNYLGPQASGSEIQIYEFNGFEKLEFWDELEIIRKLLRTQI